MSAASCKSETSIYRNCLKDSRSSGRKCTSQAKTLEACRDKWRKQNKVEHKFDGTRILPNHKCQPMNKKVQHCLQWKKGDQSQCQPEIKNLKNCMATEKGVLAAPTEGDKIWSDYNGPK